MWNHDYCTVCDKICQSGSIFCSEECRMIEAGEVSLDHQHHTCSCNSEYCMSLPIVGLNYTHANTDHSARSSVSSTSSNSNSSRRSSQQLNNSNVSLDYFSPNTSTDAMNQLAPPKKEFMYTSPLLQPQSNSPALTAVDTTNVSAPISPPMSPILMPSSSKNYLESSSNGNHQKNSFSAGNSYRRWLAAAA